MNRKILAGTAVVLVSWSTATVTQTPPSPPGDGLSDLETVTFACPKAALNAAAREVAKVPSQGTYQFAFFRIVSDSHHAAYEIHFRSNYEGEKDLKYCVAIYCQQGWDPKTSKTEVTLMTDAPKRRTAAAAGHAAHCGAPTIEGKRSKQ
jgi:hypothetical protein